MFGNINNDPKLWRQSAETLIFVIFSCCVCQGKYFRVLTYYQLSIKQYLRSGLQTIKLVEMLPGWHQTQCKQNIHSLFQYIESTTKCTRLPQSKTAFLFNKFRHLPPLLMIHLWTWLVPVPIEIYHPPELLVVTIDSSSFSWYLILIISNITLLVLKPDYSRTNRLISWLLVPAPCIITYTVSVLRNDRKCKQIFVLQKLNPAWQGKKMTSVKTDQDYLPHCSMG